MSVSELPQAIDRALEKIKTHVVPDDEARRRTEEELSAKRLQVGVGLIDKSNAPLRQLQNRKLVREGKWAETERKLVDRLCTGFLAAMIGGRWTGKTQLAVELIRMCCLSQRRARYCTATEFFMDIKATYKQASTESERDVVEQYVRPQLLVIDEIGKRGETEWEDRLLFELIDRRYRGMRDTLLISNQDRKTFVEAIGPALARRMDETGGIIEANWKGFKQA